MAATNVFLKRGADVEIKDDFGVTPIFWAAESGHVDTMRLN
jgi:ankyrin repeat protein